MEDKEKKYYTIAVLSKTCRILEALSTKNAFELADLVKTVKMPKTTVHRILMTLCAEGYVTQSSRGGLYSLSYKLFSLSRSVINQNNIVSIFQPHASKLLAEFNETVNLCITSGIEMVIVDKHSTTHTLKPDNIVGTSFAIFYSASGKATLAFYEESEFNKMMKLIQEQTTPTITKQSIELFLQDIKNTKQSGIAYDNEEIYQGVRCVATPIFDYNDKPIGAISISAPSVRLDINAIEEMETRLREEAKKISLQLGSSYPFNLV